MTQAMTQRLTDRRTIFGPAVAAALTGLLAALGATAAQANGKSPDGIAVYAEVVESVPIVELVREPVQRKVCRDVEYSDTHKSATPPILGGIIGGVVGNQFGSGSGRTASTIAGAVLGGSIGADHARSHGSGTTRRCEIVREYTESERIVGYRVTYRYDGELYTAETRRDPGEYIRLTLNVAPA